MRRRPLSVTLVAILFAYAALRGVQALFLHDRSAGYVLHATVGSLPSYFTATIGGTLLAVLAAVLLWIRHPAGFYVGIATLALGVFQVLVDTGLMASHLDVARQAYATSREARAMPLPPERLDQTFSAAGVAWTRRVGLGTMGLAGVLLLFGWYRTAATARRSDGPA